MFTDHLHNHKPHPPCSEPEEEIFPPIDAGDDGPDPELPPDPEREARRYSRFSDNDRTQIGKTARAGFPTLEDIARAKRNALKTSSRSFTLIIAGESEDEWLYLLDRWCQTYNIPIGDEVAENTLLFDFVLKTAQAEWYRIRCQRQYDSYYASFQGRSPFNWSDAENKIHDRLLRYKTSAERAFNRELRALEQHHKIPHPAIIIKKASAPNAATPEETASAEDEMPPFIVAGVDDNSPTGYTILSYVANGREVPEMKGQPCIPDDPPQFHFPPKPPSS